MATAGLKIVLPATLTDSTLPVLRDDAVLSAGSLFLADVAHSANPLAAGVPADNAALPNIAWKEASALLGIANPDKNTAAGVISVRGGITNGVKGKVERSAKGGVHTIVSQSATLANGDGISLNWPQTVLTYILANLSHGYYVSMWSAITRAATGTKNTNGFVRIDTTTGNTGVGIGAQFANSNTPVQGATGLGSNVRAVGLDAVGQSYVSWAVTSAPGTLSSAASKGAHWGALGNLNAAAFLTQANTHWESGIFYRLYLEDLTVSGRSWATVDAIDFAAYNAAFAAGGRYNGDTTPTAPSAIA